MRILIRILGHERALLKTVTRVGKFRQSLSQRYRRFAEPAVFVGFLPAEIGNTGQHERFLSQSRSACGSIGGAYEPAGQA